MLSWRGPTHPKRGGAEVYTERVLRPMIERGHSVTWYSATYPGHMPSSWHGIELKYGLPSLGVYISGLLWIMCHGKEFDVIVDQVNTFGFGTPLTSHKHKVVCLIHQLAADVWDAEARWPFNIVGRALEKVVLKLYRRTPFMTMSQTTIDELHEIGWTGTGYVTPTGIDRVYEVEKSAFPSLSFLGRFDAKAKRLEHAVAAHKKVREVVSNCELWVIGRGTAPQWLHALPGVKVYENIDDHLRDELLGAAWCCIATSVREGWGRMVTESGAAGTATVGYNVPGLRDAILDYRTGVLVEPNVEKMADVLIYLLTIGKGKLEEYSKEAREIASRTTWERSSDIFEKAVSKLVVGHTSPRRA